MEQATAVLQAIDTAGGETGPASGQSRLDVDVDIEIEAAVARVRRQGSYKTASSGDAPLPASTNGRNRFCPQCGTPTDPDDRFCANCGHHLTLKTSTKTA